MTTLNGLPAHILLVHAIVVLLPLAALLLVLCALWPAARRKLAGPNAVLAVLVLVLVPITTDAGEWLERRVAATPLVRTHTELGDTAVWAAVAVAALALVIWWRHRESTFPADGLPRRVLRLPAPRRTLLAPRSTPVTAAIAAAAILVAAGAAYDIYRIGDSGAQASWQGQFSATPAPRGSHR